LKPSKNQSENQSENQLKSIETDLKINCEEIDTNQNQLIKF